MTDYVLTGLLSRRAELTGEAEALRARLTAAIADMDSLDAVIRQFDPDYRPASVRPKRPRGPDFAGRGERSRALLTMLRGISEPITALEVTRGMMEMDGWDTENQKLVQQTKRRTLAVLARQEKRGTVQGVREEGRVIRWAVAR